MNKKFVIRNILIFIIIFIIGSIFFTNLKKSSHSDSPEQKNLSNKMILESPDFKNNEKIPIKYTGDAQNVSPSLEWHHVPKDTKSFALIVKDIDAPLKIWTHWVIFNIPSNKRKLHENIEKKTILADGAIQGINDFGNIGYNGPYPPPGKPHRYVFTLYALNTKLNISSKNITRKILEKAMKNNILAQAKLTGIYER
jgi:Raf kinase inhibitor-like YbhB/YbcL family protein